MRVMAGKARIVWLPEHIRRLAANVNGAKIGWGGHAPKGDMSLPADAGVSVGPVQLIRS